ncbi:MAG: hypothetical protein H0U66_16845 [Gemmatimonadaceae bacterium]|nr:hypothetical protein [Gemmatimonadaceae bacterium]
MLVTRLDSLDLVSGRIGDFVAGPLIPVGPTPVDVAISPDSRTAFVPLVGTTHVAIVDVRSATKTGQLTVADSPLRALVTPDATHLYITTTATSDTSSTSMATESSTTRRAASCT